MKNNIINLSAVLISIFAFSQSKTGVNTWNPQGTFHIDAAKDNPTSGTPSTVQQLNDVTVLANGNMGIGTTTPTQKLEIQTGGTTTAPVTGFKLADGNQTNSYALTSDANGVGTWKPVALPGIKGTFGGGNIASDKDVTGTNYKDSGAYIVLPRGTWAINFGATIIAGSGVTGSNKFWLHSRLTTDNTDLNSTKLINVTAVLPGGDALCAGNIFSSYNMIQGSKVYTVNADSVTIYVYFDNSNTNQWTFSPGNWENYLYATRLNIN